MDIRERYFLETGRVVNPFNQACMDNYIKWLEKRSCEPQILVWIKKMFEHAEEKQWFETYWAFDLHGTISKPDYRKGIKKNPSEASKITYYPYAKETLQLLTKTRPDIIKILWSSSYPEEIECYQKTFIEDGIIFKYINENPEITDAKGSFGFYDKKLYFNVLLEDKSGFLALDDWKYIYDYFIDTKYKPNPMWSKKYIESYHKS